MTNTESVVNFAHFLVRFPANFVNKIWEGDNHLAEHFRLKLNHLSKGERGLSPSAIINFFHELSPGNQEKFAEWVDNNFNYKKD